MCIYIYTFFSGHLSKESEQALCGRWRDVGKHLMIFTYGEPKPCANVAAFDFGNVLAIFDQFPGCDEFFFSVILMLLNL